MVEGALFRVLSSPWRLHSTLAIFDYVNPNRVSIHTVFSLLLLHLRSIAGGQRYATYEIKRNYQKIYGLIWKSISYFSKAVPSRHTPKWRHDESLQSDLKLHFQQNKDSQPWVLESTFQNVSNVLQVWILWYCLDQVSPIVNLTPVLGPDGAKCLIRS